MKTIAGIYESFGKGEIPSILAQLSENVAWDQWPDHHGQKADVPWMRPRRGRAAVTGFFEVLSQMKFKHFEVVSLTATDDRVVGEIIVEIELPNGRSYRDEELHFWRFDRDGKVASFRHYVDSAKHIEATQGWKP